MRWGYGRALATVQLAAGVVTSSAHATSSARSTPPVDSSSVACTPATLATAFSDAAHLRSIDRFGCAGRWAYVWATVGVGNQQVGVTAILKYDLVRGTWTFVARQAICHPGAIPALVYRAGCFSN